MGCCVSTGRVGDEGAALDPMKVDLRHFDVQRTLGEGGFGKVNAVVKKSAPEAGTWYAMKMLDKRVILDRRMLEEVLRELTLLKEVRGSRFVCSAYYAFQDDEHLYLVLDLYLGGDLRFHLTKAPQGRMTPQQVAFYGASLILALDFLHKNGVLHRDIKPENVLMDSAGHIALTDLGISAKVESRPPVCNQTSGTLSYMAPEVFWETHLHGIPSEAYSLGVLIHELSTGARPYPAPIWETLHHHGEEEAYYRSCDAAATAAGGLFKGREAAAVPKEMQDLIRQLLRTRPEQRGVGAEQGGLAALKTHPAFQAVDWAALESRAASPPFVPPAEANVQANPDDLFGGDGGFGGEEGPKKGGKQGAGATAIPASDQAFFAFYAYDYRVPPPPPPVDDAAGGAAAAGAGGGGNVRRSFIRLSLSKGSGTGNGNCNGKRPSLLASGAQAASLLVAAASSSSRRLLRVSPDDPSSADGNSAAAATPVEPPGPLPSIPIAMPATVPSLPEKEEGKETEEEAVPVVAAVVEEETKEGAASATATAPVVPEAGDEEAGEEKREEERTDAPGAVVEAAAAPVEEQGEGERVEEGQGKGQAVEEAAAVEAEVGEAPAPSPTAG